MPFDLQTLDWTAELRPLQDEFGQELPPEIGRLMTRSDNRLYRPRRWV